ncbi:MAG: hypothetical protein LQ346_004975 [Caloplaca aetnensis]|nr:MAG: hypothetical protein LQ346_004975 [Caloplaca aetnensis]
MAHDLLGIRDTADTPARLPPTGVNPPSQTLPEVLAPGFMMVASTQSGVAAIVTHVPSTQSGLHSGLVTDSKTFTISLMPSTTSPPVSSNPTPSAATTASATPSPVASSGLSTPKLAAVIVVPLVLLAILSPIAVVWYISWRRKRRAAKRRSDHSSLQPRPLLEKDHGVSDALWHHADPASSSPSPSRPKNAHRIVSVPTPTFSSFNFELSRPASIGPIPSSTRKSAQRPIPRNRRSATLSWGAPPPYASPTHTSFSSTSVPRLDTPDMPGSPLIQTAQMVHIRPISGQQPRLERSNSRRPVHAASARTSSSLLPANYQPPQHLNATTNVQAPEPARFRQGSADSTAESLSFRSSLQQPFSYQPLASPALSAISRLSFDPTLWASETYGSDFAISPIDDPVDNQHEAERIRPHQIV